MIHWVLVNLLPLSGYHKLLNVSPIHNHQQKIASGNFTSSLLKHAHYTAHVKGHKIGMGY